jgi:hypothetical protein
MERVDCVHGALDPFEAMRDVVIELELAGFVVVDERWDLW